MSYIELLPVMLYGIVVFLLTLLMFVLSYLLRPHDPQSEEKLSPYECGQIPIGEVRATFPYSYYLYAIVFAVVDVLSAFLFILSLSNLRLNLAAIWSAFVFILILTAGIAYSLRMLPKTMLSGDELVAFRDAHRKIETKAGEST
jgi:NADH-quinone oxidoreductase subunit A